MRDIFTFHGVLGLIRILLSPFVFYLILIGNNLTAGLLFLIATLTDLIDGFWVKEHKHNLEFSYFWDGLSDRILIFSIFLALIIKGINLFPLFLILFYALLEIIMGIMMTVKSKRFYLFHKHRVSAKLNVIVVLSVITLYIFISDYEFLLALLVIPSLLYMGIDYFVHYIKRNV